MMMNSPQDTLLHVDAARLTASFREFLDKHQTELVALKILSGRPHRTRLTALMLKELETALHTENPAWNAEALWQAYAATVPAKVKGRPAPDCLTDLMPLVRFTLGQQPVLAPFTESVRERFAAWTASRHTHFKRDELAWLERVRDHIGTSLSITEEDVDLKKGRRLFGKRLAGLLEELNEALVG